MLCALASVPEHGKAEIVGGEVVRMAPTGGLPGYAAGEIFVSLRAYARASGRGHALGDNVGFLVDLPARRSFSPDAAFHDGPLAMDFMRGAPALAVEVRSAGDYGPQAEVALAAKRADYFAAGTLVVWDVDLRGLDVIRVYRAADPAQTRVYRRGETAEAEPALLGWTFAVDELFPDGV